MLDHVEDMVIGSISTKEDNIDPISQVPAKLLELGHIITKEVGANLSEHTP
jgi:hypothetical protein